MRMNEVSIKELANTLDVSTSQIYKWNREGISKYNPHFKKIKEIFPEIQPKQQLIKKNGEEDGRYRSGRKKQQRLTLNKEEIIEFSKEKEFKSTLFPKININKKTT